MPRLSSSASWAKRHTAARPSAQTVGQLYRAVAAGQQRRLAEGSLSIIVDVDANGQAQQAAVYHTPDAALVSYVAGVLLKQLYKPAGCGGQPCAMSFPVRIKPGVE